MCQHPSVQSHECHLSMPLRGVPRHLFHPKCYICPINSCSKACSLWGGLKSHACIHHLQQAVVGPIAPRFDENDEANELDDDQDDNQDEHLIMDDHHQADKPATDNNPPLEQHIWYHPILSDKSNESMQHLPILIPAYQVGHVIMRATVSLQITNLAPFEDSAAFKLADFLYCKAQLSG